MTEDIRLLSILVVCLIGFVIMFLIRNHIEGFELTVNYEPSTNGKEQTERQINE